MKANSTVEFYQRLPRLQSFSDVTNSKAYSELPDDWLLCTADIAGSTQAVADGLYKTVNLIGAAVISSQINTLTDLEFPFIFGGDGATFCVPASRLKEAREQLIAVQRWADTEFGLHLRIAVFPVSQVHENGHSISVARYAASDSIDYAMFRGSGLLWAEKQMKAAPLALSTEETNVLPNLTGLSCRWAAMTSKNGSVLSIVIEPVKESKAGQYDRFTQKFVELVARTYRGSTPVPDEGPGVSWPPEGLALEAHASHGTRSLFLTKISLLLETFIAWVFIKTGLKIGGFDPLHYQRTTGLNADFRKFEEGLKMTLDCSEKVKNEIVAFLDKAQDGNIIRYGIHEQDACMMTCIVPSIMSDDHIHFIDGASGGYTAATRTLRERHN